MISVVKKEHVKDMLLNIIANGVPLIFLQLIAYPIVAQLIGGNEYGLMITIYSVLIIFANSPGMVLNNTRLLFDSRYKKNNIEGDFNILLFRWLLFVLLFTAIAIHFYAKESVLIHIVLGLIISVLMFIKPYCEVFFRIEIDYKAILINNIVFSCGLLCGMIMCYFTHIWEFIFLIGYGSSCVYCLAKNNFLKERRSKTIYYEHVKKDSNNLLTASIIGVLTDYADKLVLFPLMGGNIVAIYYTATIVGKIVGLLTGPINSVILTYISKWQSTNKKIVFRLLLFTIGVALIGYIFVMLIAEPVIGLLFPQWVNEVMRYIPITTINVMIGMIISVLQPFVLKFCKSEWQVIINAIASIVYFLSALMLWDYMGLTGFCIGTVIGTTTKLIIELFVFLKRTN